jgi:threonine 3-dehydrogenase
MVDADPVAVIAAHRIVPVFAIESVAHALPLADALLAGGVAMFAALRQMLESMCHGGKIAMLGIPAEPIAIYWNTVVFNMLTIKGIYGREMYETWYKMTVMLESGLDIRPVITHRFPYTEFEQGFAAMKSGESGKVILDWRHT